MGVDKGGHTSSPQKVFRNGHVLCEVGESHDALRQEWMKCSSMAHTSMDSQSSPGVLRGAPIVVQSGEFSRLALSLTPNRSHTIDLKLRAL